MIEPTWHELYYGAWQWPWALLVAPCFWLVMRTVAGRSAGDDRAAHFVWLWATVFLLETMLDPVAGLVAKDASAAVQTAVSLFFVLAGDFRIYSLVFVLSMGGSSSGRGLGVAAAAAGAVPAIAWVGNWGLELAWGEMPSQALYLLHETLFVVVCVFLARFWVPAHAPAAHARFLQRVLGWVAGYYALWVASDVLILSGIDAGWAVRCVPNQLYYALTVPAVEILYRASSSARSSTPVQMER